VDLIRGVREVKNIDFKKLVTDIGTPKLIITLSSLVLLILFITALAFMAAQRREADVFRASGSVIADFRVFYLENDFFDQNPINSNLGFLMSFTDFIEMDSRFSMRIDEEADIFYRYTATQYLIIRYLGSMNGVANPIVFRQSNSLAQEQGSTFGYRLDLADTHTVHPKNYTDFYLEFTAYQRELMSRENVIATGLRGFSAELLLEFTYNITIPEHGISESVTTGYRMSLTTEIYNLTLLGDAGASFNRILQLSDPPPELTLFAATVFVAVAALGVYGLLRGLRNLTTDPNPARSQALFLLKKYANEIVVSQSSLPVHDHRILPVDDFRDLLKLAINLNKHIMCRHDENMAEFAVVVDDNAYYFRITFNEYEDAKIEVREAIEFGEPKPEEAVSKK